MKTDLKVIEDRAKACRFDSFPEYEIMRRDILELVERVRKAEGRQDVSVPKDSTHCVFITKSLPHKSAIVRWLTEQGLDAHGDRLLLGEYGIYVTFPWQGGTVPYSKREGITMQIEAFVAGLPAQSGGTTSDTPQTPGDPDGSGDKPRCEGCGAPTE
jgi:hypothetical protein